MAGALPTHHCSLSGHSGRLPQDIADKSTGTERLVDEAWVDGEFAKEGSVRGEDADLAFGHQQANWLMFGGPVTGATPSRGGPPARRWAPTRYPSGALLSVSDVQQGRDRLRGTSRGRIYRLNNLKAMLRPKPALCARCTHNRARSSRRTLASSPPASITSKPISEAN